MNHQKYMKKLRWRRARRVRNKIMGDRDRPRLSIFRSHKHIYAQIIDDKSGNTLVAASSLSAKLDLPNCGNTQAAKEVGKLLAESAKEKGISKLAFDRGFYKYHGRVKALAEAARENGLEF